MRSRNASECYTILFMITRGVAQVVGVSVRGSRKSKALLGVRGWLTDEDVLYLNNIILLFSHQSPIFHNKAIVSFLHNH